MFGHTNIPLRQFPQFFPVVTSLLVIHTVCFLMILFHDGSITETLVSYGAVEGWRIGEGEWWRIGTALFLHSNVFAYLFSCFCLYTLGPQLEWLLGRAFFLIIYLAAGATAFWFIYLTDIDGVFYGSLGSIYGIFGIYLYLYVRKAIHPQFGMVILIITIISLLFDYPLTGVYLMSIFSGFLLSMVFLQFRRIDSDSDSDQDS